MFVGATTAAQQQRNRSEQFSEIKNCYKENEKVGADVRRLITLKLAVVVFVACLGNVTLNFGVRGSQTRLSVLVPEWRAVDVS